MRVIRARGQAARRLSWAVARTHSKGLVVLEGSTPVVSLNSEHGLHVRPEHVNLIRAAPDMYNALAASLAMLIVHTDSKDPLARAVVEQAMEALHRAKGIT